MGDRKKQFAVLGLGRFGQSIVETLSDNGYEVLACDRDGGLVHEVSSFATHAVEADITDEAALEELGIRNFDCVIVATGSSLETAILATLLLKEMGVAYVLVKANDFVQKRILEKLGADRVVLPEREMGHRIAINLITGNVIDFANVSEDHSMIELEPLPSWIGLTLAKANVRANTGINIVAIRRDKHMVYSPQATEVINKGDCLIAISENKNLLRFKQQHGKEVSLSGLFN